MPVYAVTYHYPDDSVDARAAVRPAHREFLRGLAERGTLLVSGPYAAEEAPGALLLFRAGTKDEVHATVAEDPFSTEGLVTAYEVVEWEPVTGSLAAGFEQR
jgi:hypothetical protein